MRFSMGLLSTLAAVSILAACSGDAPKAEPAAADSAQATSAKPSEEELLALLPDRTTADCLGNLDFVSQRRVEGRSHCSGAFSGTTDGSLAAGTSCVYSTKVQTKTTTEFTAAGHFVCSEGSHGTVVFKEQRNKVEGVATATTTGGRVVTIIYQD